MTFAAVEASGLERWLAGLREELVSKTYRPDPVRRVSIPKPDGGERPLGIAYADDFVILSRGCAAEALAWTKVMMTRLGLTLNEAKTFLLRPEALVPSHPIGCIVEKTGAVLHCIKCT